MAHLSRFLLALSLGGFLLGGPVTSLPSSSSFSGLSSAPTAKTLNGSYTGVYNPTFKQDLFLGVPFAQPPVEQLRFRQAQPLNTSWTGLKNATVPGTQCIGYGSDDWNLPDDSTSEDCLTLNIVRPSGEGENLPVGVWIFGGGMVEGGTRDPRYNLSFIVEQSVKADQPFIAIGINYRLQAWGFLGGREVVEAGSTNMGMRDQRLALHWIQENIAGFGGDPEKVTIWGESAGASSVGAHLIAYGGRDDKLFRAAIMESGAPKGSYSAPETWQKYYDNITLATNCSFASDSLDCLRKVPVNALSSIFNSSVISSASFGPQLDGDFIRGSGTDQIRNGQFVKVPILHGRNHDEGTSFATKGVNTDAEFETVLLNAGVSEATALTVAALYPDIPEIGIPGTLHGRPPASDIVTLGSQWKRAAAYAGDINHHAPRRFLSLEWAKNNLTSFSYVFNVWPHGEDVTIGATHFTEVAFVFHNIYGAGYNTSVSADPFADKPETYVQVSSMMSRMWASFISTLDPNNNGFTNVIWPGYTLDKKYNIVFDVNATDLAYDAPDFYRTEAIGFLIDNFV